MHQHLNYRGPRKRREKERLWENFWRDYSWKFHQHGKGRPLGQYQMHQHLNYRGPRRRGEKERVWENFWRDYTWKFPRHGKGNSQSSPRDTKSPIQDKSKEKYAKTHTNQTNKD